MFRHQKPIAYCLAVKGDLMSNILHKYFYMQLFKNSELVQIEKNDTFSYDSKLFWRKLMVFHHRV